MVEFVNDREVSRFVKALRRLLQENAYARGDMISALEVAALQSGHVEVESPDSFDCVKGWDWKQGAYAHSCTVKFQQDTGVQREEHGEEYIDWLLAVFERDLLDPESYRENGDDMEVLLHVAAYVYAHQYVCHMMKIVERKGRHISPSGQRSMFEREVQKVLSKADWLSGTSKINIIRNAYKGQCPLY